MMARLSEPQPPVGVFEGSGPSTSGSGVVVRRRQPFRRGRASLGVLTLVSFGVRPQQRPNRGAI